MWNGKSTAEKYDKYAAEYPMYKETNKFLVELAKINKGMTVLDLACGTGLTTLEILKKLGNSGKVISIDSSKYMLDIAKGKIKQENVSFVLSPAENVNELVKGKIGLVLCNSAFWQTDMPKTLQAIHSILKQEGKFVFNFPDQFFQSKDNPKSKYLRKVMAEVANEYGHESYLDAVIPKTFKLWTYESIKKLLESNSFKLTDYKEFILKRTAEDIKEHLGTLGVMAIVFPNLTDEERAKILDKTINRLDESNLPDTTWACFVAEKII